MCAHMACALQRRSLLSAMALALLAVLALGVMILLLGVSAQVTECTAPVDPDKA